LQQRTAAYQELQTDATELRLLLALRAGGTDNYIYSGANPSAAPADSAGIDGTIQSTLTRLGPATNIAKSGVFPLPDEQTALSQIQQDYSGLSAVIERIIASDQAGDPSQGQLLQHLQAEPLANDLVLKSGQLVTAAKANTADLIALNTGAYTDSQRLFIAVAAGSIVLALVLGYALSWSLVGPLRRMGGRLAAIAGGDFSGHVDVQNRDELGTFAANLNRMNDELGRLYGELETASRHKSEFLANMSHELRTPLNAIIGFSQVLRERMFGELNARQADYVDDILSSGQHLLSLINDILDLAKIEAGSLELQPSVFALPGVLDTAMAMVCERATRQGVSLVRKIDPSVMLVQADERKIKQILFNLLSNAVKFTPAGGRITLCADTADGRVGISVADNGVGISNEDQTRIFEEFYQVGPGKNQEGTGLGLPLARRLVELHGGQLLVRSVPGQGSTFSFTVPIQQDQLLSTAEQCGPIATVPV
jgi:signal transduction histidine kinase